ncbi:MAG: hypothetical protein IPK83_24645 [Planctomycetes bacterium]|nr:hypothetical protein [Planctomycetota bacterium]
MYYKIARVEDLRMLLRRGNRHRAAIALLMTITVWLVSSYVSVIYTGHDWTAGLFCGALRFYGKVQTNSSVHRPFSPLKAHGFETVDIGRQKSHKYYVARLGLELPWVGIRNLTAGYRSDWLTKAEYVYELPTNGVQFSVIFPVWIIALPLSIVVARTYFVRYKNLKSIQQNLCGSMRLLPLPK